MSDICKCGVQMGVYEQETYGVCGYCHTTKKKEERDLAAKETKKRKEEQRLEKLEYERLVKLEVARRKEVDRKIHNDYLLALRGKIIENAYVQEWVTILGEETPNAVVLECTDGTTVRFERECMSDGCRGQYDYYYYLGIAIE